MRIYESSFVPLYNALTQKKTKTHMKLVCQLPDEKVGLILCMVCSKQGYSETIIMTDDNNR